MKARFLALVALFFPLANLTNAADSIFIAQAELVRRTQELYDALSAGNPAPFKKYFADDCIFSDEKGRTLDKAKLVADIAPLPTGYSGVIKIDKPQSRIAGDAALLNYDLDEKEAIFGQNLTARYHVTDIWLRRNGEWQIVASQAMRYYEDPAISKADPKKFPDYIGTYELAPGQIRTVSVKEDRLLMERKGKTEQLFPETCDLFFRKDVEGRILFRRNDHGEVDALIDRRNNEDVVWRKNKWHCSSTRGVVSSLALCQIRECKMKLRRAPSSIWTWIAFTRQ